MLELRNVTVRYGGVTPLDRVSLTFEAGINGLVGPNGAGKTTLLNVVNGFVAPAHGSVTAYGENLLRMPAHRRARWGLGRTFQRMRIVHELSAADNVAIPLEHGSRDATLAASDVLALVGLEESAERLGASLSKLDARLVELARAAAGGPKVILLDEPGAGLDAGETQTMAQRLRNLAAQTAATIILVDHDMELVRAVCAHVAVLDFGKVIAAGDIDVLDQDEVRDAYFGSVLQ